MNEPSKLFFEKSNESMIPSQESETRNLSNEAKSKTQNHHTRSKINYSKYNM